MEAVIAQFPTRLRLMSPDASLVSGGAPQRMVARVLDQQFGYLRLATLESTATSFRHELEQLVASNSLAGIILDLRFSRGGDLDAVAAIASLGISGQKPLFDGGSGMRRSDGVTVSGDIPWVVLVNAETVGAPEALAGVLRRSKAALVMGSKTAGLVGGTLEVSLSNGQRVTFLTQSARLTEAGVATATLPGGWVPDIQTEASLEQDRVSVLELIKPMPGESGGTGIQTTPRAGKKRLNEADLVRMQREGRRTDSELPDTTTGPSSKPSAVSEDKTLSRALDLLKGLSVLRKKPTPMRG